MQMSMKAFWVGLAKAIATPWFLGAIAFFELVTGWHMTERWVLSLSMFCSGLLAASAIYSGMLRYFFTSNKRLRAELETLQEATNELMQMRAQDIGKAIAADLKGIMNVDVRPITKH